MCVWFTNIPHTKRNTPLDLYRKYSNEDYPKYDNYDAIEVSKVSIFLAISTISDLSIPTHGLNTGIRQAASVQTIAYIVWLAT